MGLDHDGVHDLRDRGHAPLASQSHHRHLSIGTAIAAAPDLDLRRPVDRSRLGRKTRREISDVDAGGANCCLCGLRIIRPIIFYGSPFQGTPR